MFPPYSSDYFSLPGGGARTTEERNTQQELKANIVPLIQNMHKPEDGTDSFCPMPESRYIFELFWSVKRGDKLIIKRYANL